MFLPLGLDSCVSSSPGGLCSWNADTTGRNTRGKKNWRVKKQKKQRKTTKKVCSDFLSLVPTAEQLSLVLSLVAGEVSTMTQSCDTFIIVLISGKNTGKPWSNPAGIHEVIWKTLCTL